MTVSPDRKRKRHCLKRKRDIMAKNRLLGSAKGPTPLEIRMAAEKAYRKARRDLARAQRIAGTFDKKEFAKTKKNLLVESAKDLKRTAKAQARQREQILKSVVRKNKGQSKGAGAKQSADAIFDLIEKARRNDLREQMEAASQTELLEMQEAALNDTLDKVEEKELGNKFEPGNNEDWSRIY